MKKLALSFLFGGTLTLFSGLSFAVYLDQPNSQIAGALVLTGLISSAFGGILAAISDIIPAHKREGFLLNGEWYEYE